DVAAPLTEMEASGDWLYFTFQDAEHGNELWKTDGSAGGTSLVADLRPGADGSSPRQLADAGGSLVFVATADAGGSALYRTDGTPAGTMALRAFDGTDLRRLETFRDGVAFSARDAEHGVEVWFSDGTAAGTRLVADVNTEPQGSYVSWLDLPAIKTA